MMKNVKDHLGKLKATKVAFTISETSKNICKFNILICYFEKVQ